VLTFVAASTQSKNLTFSTSRPPLPLPTTLAPEPAVYFSRAFQALNQAIGFSDELNHIIATVEEVTTALNLLHLSIHAETANPDPDPLSLRETLTSIQYSLLSIDSKSTEYAKPTRKSEVQEICRLGILLYLVTILSEFPPGASVCNMLAEKLQRSLEYTAPEHGLTVQLRLWLMFLASSSTVISAANKTWFTASLMDIVSKFGVSRRWEDVKTILMSFFWVEKIHGESFAILCRQYGGAMVGEEE